MKKIEPVPSLDGIDDWDFYEGEAYSLSDCVFVDAVIFRDGGTCEVLFKKNGKIGALLRILGYFPKGNIHFGKFLFLDIDRQRAILLRPDQIVGLEAFLEEYRARIPDNVYTGLLQQVE